MNWFNNNKKEDSNLEFKNWNLYFVKIHEKIFEISALEPTVYYRKVDFLKYTLAIKSLLTLSKIYITERLENINALEQIIEYITGQEFMNKVLKEVNILSKNSEAIFIQDEKTIQLVKKVINIFEDIQYNLSLYEIIPKTKMHKQNTMLQDLDPEEKKYFDFVNYIEN